MKIIYLLLLLFPIQPLFAQQEQIRPLSQFVGYYNVGTKPNKPFFKSRWYLKDGDLYTIYDADIDRKFEPYIEGKLNYNVVYNEKDLPEIKKEDTTYYVVLTFEEERLDRFKIVRPRSEWSTDLYGYRIPDLNKLAIDPENQMKELMTTAHFKFIHSNLDTDFVKEFATKIESRYNKLLSDFNIKKLPITTFKIYPNLESYHNGVLTPHAPDWQKGRVWTENEVKLVSPTYLKQMKGEEISDELLVHEFIHILHWHKKGNPNSIPKWLWEGLALYKGCCKWEELDQIDFMKNKKFPSLKTINWNPEMQYQLGYYIIEFITEKWGWHSVLQLVDNNGNIKKSLGLSNKGFEDQFYKHLESQYLDQ